MSLDPDRLLSLSIASREVVYRDREPIQYALAVGAGADELDLVYERDLKVIPSFVQILGFDDSWLAAGGVDLASVVHGGLDIRFEGGLAPSGAVTVETEIVGLSDKGAGRGGIIQLQTRLTQGGIAVSRSLSSLFVRGGGGFGGDRGVQPEAIRQPDTDADGECETPTTRNQALLFRLLGDRNPLHVDPQAARTAGFEAPILHGAATFGVACLTVLRRYCAGDPARLLRFAARFSGPLYPGETLVFSFWRTQGGAMFRARAKERASPVLDGGLAQFRD